jgi:hypothetical protein
MLSDGSSPTGKRLAHAHQTSHLCTAAVGDTHDTSDPHRRLCVHRALRSPRQNNVGDSGSIALIAAICWAHRSSRRMTGVRLIAPELPLGTLSSRAFGATASAALTIAEESRSRRPLQLLKYPQSWPDACRRAAHTTDRTRNLTGDVDDAPPPGRTVRG